MSWISRWFSRARLDRELSAELEFHLDQHVRDLTAAGVPPAEARRRARIALGGLEQVKEEARDVRGTRWLEDLGADVRFAFRMLRKAPGFAAAAILTLAIGIGANAAVFSVVDALFLRTLPVERPEELFSLVQRNRGEPDDRASRPSLTRFRAALPPGARLTASTRSAGMYFLLDRTPERYAGQLVAGDWFSVLGVTAAAGRLIGPEDDQTEDGHPVVVLSHGLWTRRFGADPAVVGRTIRINGAPMVVIGVAQRGFAGLLVENAADFWAPLSMQHALRYAQNANMNDADPAKPWGPQEGIRWLQLVGRASAAAPLTAIAPRLTTVFLREREQALAAADSATRAYEATRRLEFVSAARGFSDLRDGLTETMKLLAVTVMLVLLVACANLAGLLLARNAARAHEIAVRVSLGARGGRLVRQVLTETIVLSALGGLAGLAVAWFGAAALLRAVGDGGTSLPVALHFDARLVAVAAVIALLTGVLFGLPPALRIGRSDWAESFRSSGRVVVAAPGQAGLGRWLVVGQIAVSLALVVIAGVLVRSVQALMRADPGYDRQAVLSARVDVRGAGYRPEELPALYRRLEETVRQVPGVVGVGLAQYGFATGSAQTSSIAVPGKVRPPGWDDAAQVTTVSRGYLQAAGLRLLSGRFFTEADRPGALRAAVVTRAMARRFFETDNPVGQRFGYDSTPVFEVVGVVADITPNDLREGIRPLLLLSLDQEAPVPIYNIVARVAGVPEGVARSIKSALAAAEPALPVREIVTVGELLDRGVRADLMVTRVAGLFGVLAALLAAIGLYGVMSYAVARRSNEMGVRLALGAEPGRLRRMVIGDSFKVVALGVVAGLGVTGLALGAVERLVYGVSPRDPVSIGVAVAVLLLVGFGAAAVPAWRASRVDPVTALRRD